MNVYISRCVRVLIFGDSILVLFRFVSLSFLSKFTRFLRIDELYCRLRYGRSCECKEVTTVTVSMRDFSVRDRDTDPTDQITSGGSVTGPLFLSSLNPNSQTLYRVIVGVHGRVDTF